MRKYLTILFICLLQNTSNAQTANAGADQTIYLSQTNYATLDGSASTGTSFQWREISTDYSSGGTITSPTSKTTTITGLKQGTFYFELSATTGGITKRDSVVVRVESNPPPIGSLLNYFQMNNSIIIGTVNWRGDTTSFFPDSDPHSQTGDASNSYDATQWWILYRDRVNNIGIDTLRGKLTSIIQDGYGQGSMINGTQVKYPRTEVVMDKPGTIDTNHIYTFRWKGYFPNETNYMTGNNAITAIFQIHADSSYGENTMDFSLKADGTIVFTYSPNGPREKKFPIGTFTDWVNKSHTIDFTIREGYGSSGNPAFMKVDIDGQQMVMIDTGRIGGTPGGNFNDFAKFGTLYDAANAMVDANATGGTRKFSLITEKYERYTVTSMPPLANAGPNQVIILPSTSTTLNGTAIPVTSPIANYQWTKLSGGNATIVSPTLLSTNINGLSQGTYKFNLQVTDVNGLSSNSTVQVIVDSNRTVDVTGYNYDVIVDGVLNGTVSSLRNMDFNSSGFSFYVSGFSTNSTPILPQNGLPTDGIIISPTNTRYKLQPYNQNNALYLDYNHSGTLSLVSPAKFSKIKIAYAAGAMAMTYQINYSDGTNDNGTLNVPDWGCQGCSGYAINNLGRIDASGSVGTTYWSLHEDSILPNPNKTINSITFNASTTWFSLFALTSSPVPPTISISGDQTITVDNTSVSAVATWASGHTGTYAWTKLSGPGSTTIGSPTSASTTVTGLQTGTYVLQCTVTQDDGQTASGTVTITVNIPNVPPTANAGTDQTITLPTSSITLTGTGTDTDGTIASYSWSKVSGGTATITSASSSTTTVTGLAAGVYVFRLTVTDNSGATGTDDVQVTVTQAAPPNALIQFRTPHKFINQ